MIGIVTSILELAGGRPGLLPTILVDERGDDFALGGGCVFVRI